MSALAHNRGIVCLAVSTALLVACGDSGDATETDITTSTTSVTSSSTTGAGVTTDLPDMTTTGAETDPFETTTTAGPGAVCGDGQLADDEECDDGNADNTDDCLDTCVQASCGDGEVWAGVEECDDGNSDNNDACTDMCLGASCGDGFAGPGEECDDGNADNTDGCLDTCVAASCGDGYVGPGEGCDDGNDVDDDECSNTCVPATCGDGVLQPGEICDDGNGDDTDACLSSCAEASCGDGAVWEGVEECDDGNPINEDACLDTCVPASCGDGFVQEGVEDCDDANADNADDCIDTCALASCGDGYVYDGIEVCDDGNGVNDDGCETDCTLSSGAKSVAHGYYHSCAVFHNGDVRCWGRNSWGNLGIGNTAQIGDNEHPNAAPIVDVGGPVTQVVAGEHHTCALLEGGSVRCWGYGGHGALGYGNTTQIGDNESPASAGDVPVGEPVIQLAAGRYFTCALLESQNVRCWGQNPYGQLGTASTTQYGDNEPASAAPTVELGGVAVAEVSCGEIHTCARTTDGEVYCWGYAGNGALGYANTTQIGDNETPATAGAVQVGGAVIAIGTGRRHTCAVLDNNQVNCWGYNNRGQLGRMNTTQIGDNETPASVGVIQLGADAVAIDGGYEHTCAALTNGSVRCWGHNQYGNLGLASTLQIGDGLGEMPPPNAGVGAPVTELTTTYLSVCARTTTSGVRCWGWGSYGNLGYSSTANIGDNELPSALGDVMIE
ncbi:MAG: hypothetical protein H6713_37210 [Myxococcales bacterium]|nr:hypothetical protein [Myxococcales bacterium]MCB9755604.1 hypothetical protein [Myxococcales bacterium]